MSPFITFRDIDKEGNLSYFILQRQWPHYVGIITDKHSVDALASANITSHSLYVRFYGVLEGHFVPAHRGVQEEIKEVFQKMADWYYKHRVIPNPKRFKKWAYASLS